MPPAKYLKINKGLDIKRVGDKFIAEYIWRGQKQKPPQNTDMRLCKQKWESSYPALPSRPTIP